MAERGFRVDPDDFPDLSEEEQGRLRKLMEECALRKGSTSKHR